MPPLQAPSEAIDLSAHESEENKSANKEVEGSAMKDLPGGFEERIVWHFLYKEWPDFSVPDFEDFGSFFTLMRLSREKNANFNNPRIVHCSAGVGRSWTFIALEHLMRELDAGVLEQWDGGIETHKGTDKHHDAIHQADPQWGD